MIMKKVVFIFLGLLGISAIVLIVIGLQKIRSYPSPRPIYVTESDRDTPANLLDKKQDRNYVTTLAKSPNTLQIQG